MAERGVEEDNPFSFKKFVSTKDKPPSHDVNEVTFTDISDIKSSDGDNDNIFGLSSLELSSAKPRDGHGSTTTTTASAGGAASQKGSLKKNKQKENPFSFKKFISSSSTVSKKGSNSILISSESSDTELTNSIPDQTQTNGRVKDPIIGLSVSSMDKLATSDSFHLETTSKEPLAPLDLPFPEAKVEATSDFKHFNFHDREELHEIDSPLDVKDGVTGGPLSLPDFLTDTAMLNGRQTMAGPVNDKTGGNYEDLLDKISLLQEENDTLRSDLNREKLKNQEKNHKLSQLKVDLERQKKKEAEDMSVLEKAVQQVEENLVTTTKRAVQAEATVTKLKQEVRSLQKHIKILSAESEAYKSGDRGLTDIRERTKYTSDELKSAAFIAEKNIKELMVGVDKLKLLSQVLSSLEKVTDFIPEMPQEDDTKPS